MADRARTARALWAFAGVVLIFGNAVLRLGARGVAVMLAGLAPAEWAALLLLTALFVYGEGVRALERRYVPHLLGRIALLRDERRPIYQVLAPLYALSLVGATRRSLAYAWAGISGIILAVMVVSRFPEPWRGITDFAVAAALAWGLVAIVRGAVRTRLR
ncbi:MAG TPA: hypothetical protein VMN60_13175 [Longimicrobiales bacterium]|nr:hypothetical protein [Longimicrobiales bacterium]